MNTHPAERETPAGEAMREAVKTEIRKHIRVDASGLAPAIAHFYIDGFDAAADAVLAGPIASELARLTERAEKAETFALACELRIATAEAALTTLRADHAAEVARLTEALRFYADEDAWSGQPWRLQFESPGRDGHGSDTARDALATTETTDA